MSISVEFVRRVTDVLLTSKEERNALLGRSIVFATPQSVGRNYKRSARLRLTADFMAKLTT